jgi:hypothetical protein
MEDADDVDDARLEAVCCNQSYAKNCAAGLGPATPQQKTLRRAELPPPSPPSRA